MENIDLQLECDFIFELKILFLFRPWEISKSSFEIIHISISQPISDPTLSGHQYFHFFNSTLSN